MISDIIDVWKTTKVPAADPKHICKFCNKGFTKESTLVSHACEKKRRHQQESETGVQWGFRSYQLFYNSTQTSNSHKTYQDFCDSPYYTAFVKFGRYCVDIRCININSFTQWLLKNNKKLDYWTSDRLYDEWLYTQLRNESVQDALERGLKEMQEYAETNTQLKNGYTDYFRYGNVNRICHHISAGRISPWVLYNCDTGVDFLGNLDDDQVKIIISWIDPPFWNSKFKDSTWDVEWAKSILLAAGL